MKFYAKVHKSEKGSVLAVCDENILGKTVSGEDVIIEVTEKFYGGDLVDSDKLKDLLLESSIINLIGNECVKFAESLGLIENKIMIGDIAHAQIYQI